MDPGQPPPDASAQSNTTQTKEQTDSIATENADMIVDQSETVLTNMDISQFSDQPEGKNANVADFFESFSGKEAKEELKEPEKQGLEPEKTENVTMKETRENPQNNFVFEIEQMEDIDLFKLLASDTSDTNYSPPFPSLQV